MNIYEEAINKFGELAQIIVAIEEMSEVIKTLTKHLRGKDNQEDIIEELVDAQIMINQMIVLFKCKSQFDIQMDTQLTKLRKLIDKHK